MRAFAFAVALLVLASAVVLVFADPAHDDGIEAPWTPQTVAPAVPTEVAR